MKLFNWIKWNDVSDGIAVGPTDVAFGHVLCSCSSQVNPSSTLSTLLLCCSSFSWRCIPLGFSEQLGDNIQWRSLRPFIFAFTAPQQFQSSFRAVPEQFQSDIFKKLIKSQFFGFCSKSYSTGPFQSSSRAVSEQYLKKKKKNKIAIFLGFCSKSYSTGPFQSSSRAV